MQTSLLLFAVLLGTHSQPDSTVADLLRAMHDRYAGRWPAAVTFVQKSTFHEGDSTRVETWYEAVGSPSNLRIDFAPLENGNGLIFRSDSIYSFKGDSLVHAGPQVHPLLVLSRDVYFLPPEEVLPKLAKLGFDLSQVREDAWQGRPAMVVGGGAEDLTSPQFWVDKERLVFVRLIEPAKEDSTKTQEVRFNEYRPLGEGWIETEVLFFEDGRIVFEESYADIRDRVKLDEDLFDPGRWGRPAWVEGDT